MSISNNEGLTAADEELTDTMARDREFVYWMKTLRDVKPDPDEADELRNDMWRVMEKEYDVGPELKKATFRKAAAAIIKEKSYTDG